MDPTQAKLILASFRPNGSDLHDPAFAEALALAAQDQDLGEWLARERAQDLAFAESLADFPIPETLRESLYEVLASADSKPGYSEFDHNFASFLGEIEPPASLRGDILAAMEIERKVAALPTARAQTSRKPFPQFSGLALAAAAGIVAAVLWSLIQVPQTGKKQLVARASHGSITTATVRREAINFLDNNFTLDRTNLSEEELYQFLTSNSLPSPTTLPAGLQGAVGVGCKKLDFQKIPASLICYQQVPGEFLVHLIVFRKTDILDELPTLASAGKHCRQCPETGWAMASWRDEDKAFLLLSKMKAEQLAAVF